MTSVTVLSANVGLMGEIDDFKSMVAKFVALVARHLQSEPDLLVVCLQEFAHLRSPQPIIHEGCVAALDAALATLASATNEYSGLVFTLGADIGSDYSGLCTFFFARVSDTPVHVLHRVQHSWHTSRETAAFSAHDRYEAFAHGRRFPSTINPSNGRKGFLELVFRTPHGTQFSVTNLHLPADNDNVEAFKQSPSHYHEWRRACWQYALARVAQTHGCGLVVAGDINVRLDGAAMMAVLRRDGDVVSEKTFRCAAVEEAFAHNNGSALRESWDREVALFNVGAEPHRVMYERPIAFAPTYCYTEDGTRSAKRAPAWTDRILVDAIAARAWTGDAVRYTSDAWGGDHHAVALRFSVP